MQLNIIYIQAIKFNLLFISYRKSTEQYICEMSSSLSASPNDLTAEEQSSFYGGQSNKSPKPVPLAHDSKNMCYGKQQKGESISNENYQKSQSYYSEDKIKIRVKNNRTFACIDICGKIFISVVVVVFCFIGIYFIQQYQTKQKQTNNYSQFIQYGKKGNNDEKQTSNNFIEVLQYSKESKIENNHRNQNTNANEKQLQLKKAINPSQTENVKIQQPKKQTSQQQKIQQIAKQNNEKQNIPQANKLKVNDNFHPYSKKIINEQYIKIPYGTIPELKVKVQKPEPSVPNFSNYGFQKQIQISSQFDYLNLTQKINFTQVEHLLVNSLPHQLYTFAPSALPSPSPPSLALSTLNSPQAYQSHLQKIKPPATSPPRPSNFDMQYIIASKLKANPDDQLMREFEYLYYNEKYQIGSQEQGEQPICVFSMGYNLVSRNAYKDIFLSLQRVNYTNFKIVYIDDFSPDDTYKEVYKFLDERNSSLRNKITIVRNLQRVQGLANMFVHSKYCEGIVVICDGDDGFIGRQSFQVLNKVYKQNIWYVWSRYLLQRTKGGILVSGCSAPLSQKTQNYRSALFVWTTSHTRSFRKQLMQAVPIQNFLQYQYIPQQSVAYPKFYGTQSCDRFQVYAHIEMSGQAHSKFINDYLYMYNSQSVPNFCKIQKGFYEEYKCRAKTPLSPLGVASLANPVPKAKIRQNYAVPQVLLNKISATYAGAKDKCKLH